MATIPKGHNGNAARPPALRGSVIGIIARHPEPITMVAPQPLWFVLPALLLLTEQALAPPSLLPTVGGFILAAGLHRRAARSPAMRILARCGPLQQRPGLLLHLVDDTGRRWNVRFLPVTPMELRIGDPVFTDGRIDRHGQLRIRALTNIRTGVRRRSRAVMVWPIVLGSTAIMLLTVISSAGFGSGVARAWINSSLW